MRLIALCMYACIIAFSCNQQGSSYNNTKSEVRSVEKEEANQSHTSSEIQENVTSNAENHEASLKEGLNSYYEALLAGNIDKAYSLFYKGAMDYYKSEFPAENIDDTYIKENILGVAYRMINNLNETKKADFKYRIGDVICKQDYEGTLIYVVETSLDGTVDGERKGSPGRVVCISTDKGQSWTYLAVDEEETKPLLTSKFNYTVARNVLECK